MRKKAKAYGGGNQLANTGSTRNGHPTCSRHKSNGRIHTHRRHFVEIKKGGVEILHF